MGAFFHFKRLKVWLESKVRKLLKLSPDKPKIPLTLCLSKKVLSYPPRSCFPSDVLKYIKKNANARQALKFMQVCKYFCHQRFPYNVVTFIIGDYEPGELPGWLLHSVEENSVVHISEAKDIPHNLWVMEWFEIYQEFNVIYDVIPKIAYCECQRLILKNQNLSVDDYKILTSSGQVEFLNFSNTFVQYQKKVPVPFEKLLETLPKIKEIRFENNCAPSIIEFDVFKRLVPSTLKHLIFCDPPKYFNYVLLFRFIEAHHVRHAIQQEARRVRKPPKWIQFLHTLYHDWGLKHACLILVLILYNFLGAAIFYYCEASHDENQEVIWKDMIQQNRSKFIQNIIPTMFNNTEFLFFLTGEQTKQYYYNLAWKVHIYSIIAICCIFYPIMFWRIKTLKTAKNNSKMRSEIKLMYSALVLFFANLLYAAYFVFRDQMIAQYKEFGKYSEWTLFLLADVYDLHNSYALVFTSKEVRKAVWKTIKFSNDDSVTFIPGGLSVAPRPKDGSTNFNTIFKTDSTIGITNVETVNA